MKYEYYEILEIERNATDGEIKKAYRKKAMEFHPDRNPWNSEAEAKFKKINEAYSVLSDPQKKANYDQFGSAEGFGGGSGGFAADFDMGDIFSQFFGGGFSGGRASRMDLGEDIEIRMSISLEDAIKGTNRKVEYKKRSTCTACSGDGGETETCTACSGNGRVKKQIRTMLGIMEQVVACDACAGKWKLIKKACKMCDATGTTEESISKKIDIPKGIEDGMSIKFRDEGHSGKDGDGDLYITFSVPNKEGGLERKGSHLWYTLSISPAEATLGVEKEITIPILGKKKIKINHGSQQDTEIRFKWEGITPVDHRSTGDLIVKINITIPKKLSAEQKKLYEAILESEWWELKKWWLEEWFGG